MNEEQQEFHNAVVEKIGGCLFTIAKTLEILRLESAESHVEKRKIQKIAAKVEQVEQNDIDLVKLYSQIQGASTTDLTQLANRLERLMQQVAAIPPIPPAPDLSNSATKQEVANLTRQLKSQGQNTIIAVAIATTAIMLFAGIGLNSTRSSLNQEIQTMEKKLPMLVEMYRQEEGDGLRSNLKKYRQKNKQ